MIILAAYLAVLAVAAFFTFHAFGSGSRHAAAVALNRGCGLDFFFPAGPRNKRGITDALRSAVDARHGEMLSFLQDACCALPVQAETVRVLTHPTQFYEELQRRVLAAKHSIVMSALYIGDGPLSQQLVACLERKVAEAVNAAQQLDVSILLDYNRMQDRQNLHTVVQLLTLAHTTPDALVRVRLCLFQSPCRWNRLFAPFGRAREVLGVQHTKIFCFDGRDSILTGANLSDDYFTTRMDRYVVIENNTPVASWFSDLVQTLCCASHRVICRKEFDRSGGGGSKSGGEPTLHKKSDLVILPNDAGIDPSRDSAAFSRKMKQLLQGFAARAAAMEVLPEDAHCDTFLFPTLQCARADVFHDSLIVQHLLHMAPASTHIYLASPYLNMYAQFVDELLASESVYDFITASVNTNGWRGAKGFAGYIPFFYLQLERAFYYLMQDYGCSDRVRVREFSVDGLTFHAKGLWFAERRDGTKNDCKSQCSSSSSSSSSSSGEAGHNNNNNNNNHKNGDRHHHHHHNNNNNYYNGRSSRNEDAHIHMRKTEGAWADVKAPYIVAYGSTNYGHRSVHKDVEAELFLFTANPSLREALRNELVFLLQQSSVVTEERFVRGAQGRFQPVVSLLAQIGQDFL